MANLTEVPTYEAGIYRFETTDPVQGGPGGIDNLPTNQLANRTAWLKAQVEAILLDIAAIESGYAPAASLASHTGNTSNPHGVTKTQVGLGSVLNYGVATQAEAEAGSVDTKYMTPLRAKQAIAALVPAASETVAGLIEMATQEEAQALTDVMRAITPATLAGALKGANQILLQSGYQRLPGGLILQWGSGTSNTSGVASVTHPLSFPSAVFARFAIVNNVAGAATAFVLPVATNAQQTRATSVFQANTSTSVTYFWFAIGY